MTDIPKAERRYTLKGRECRVVTWPVYKRGVKRNVLIEYLDDKSRVVRPFRGLRRKK